MFKKKFLISTIVFVTFLIITSFIKNKTRIIEKQITNLNKNILLNKKDINETQLDFHYLTSPAELEKRLNLIGFQQYQPIIHSKIFFSISDLIKLENKISKIEN